MILGIRFPSGRKSECLWMHGLRLPRRYGLCSPVPSTTKNPQTKWSASFLVDIPSRWEPQAKQSRTVALLTALCAALRVAFADFSSAPWRGLEKSERCPNNSSLFRPQAAVVVVAVRVLYRPPQKNPQTKWSGDCGGRYRTRTCDLLHVKQMLYQLS